MCFVFGGFRMAERGLERPMRTPTVSVVLSWGPIPKPHFETEKREKEGCWGLQLT